jgi:hypothetical protein
MSTKYAQGTVVTPEKTLAEIKKLVAAHGGTDWKYGEDGSRIVLGFTLNDVAVRLEHTLPSPTDSQFARDGRGRQRPQAERMKAYGAETRRRWRVLLLRLKVRFEMMTEGDESAAQAFAAYLVGPDGSTVEQSLFPQLVLAQTERRLLASTGGE